MGDELIGFARDIGTDMPNVYGTFEPTAAFENVRQLFDEEYALLDNNQLEERGKVMAKIFAMGLRIETDEGTVLTGMKIGESREGKIGYLHIHDSQVWWRPVVSWA